jgi:SpoIID/LytB domain protein
MKFSRLLVGSILLSLISGLTPVWALGPPTPGSASIHRFDQLFRESSEGGRDSIEIQFPLMLAVGLMGNQSQIRVTASGPFEISVGGQTFTGASGQIWKAVLVSGEPAVMEYLPIVAEFPLDELAQAEALAQSWRDRGYSSRVMVKGSVLARQALVIGDNRKIYVSVGTFENEPDARAFMQQLVGMGQSPWLMMQKLKPQSGVMALIDPAGTVRAQGGEIRWKPTPSGGVTMKVFDVEFDIGLPQHGKEDRRYEGIVRTLIDKDGKLGVVNDIELEAYLQGVIPSEVYSSDPMETLKAQTVASRGKTLATLGSGLSVQPWDTCADQYCQVYTGIERQHPRTTQAVQETSGKVLARDGKVIAANFADTCGGHSENIENVWSGGPDPSFVGVPDSAPGQSQFPAELTEATLRTWILASPPCYCKGTAARPNPYFRWTVTRTSSELTQKANQFYPVGTVLAFEPVARGVSGRLKSLRIKGSGGEVVVNKELTIRRVLGGLGSSLFYVTVERDASGAPVRWTFRGAGRGHGVGLCQVGARGAAEAGLLHPAILAHYFKNCAIVTLH